MGFLSGLFGGGGGSSTSSSKTTVTVNPVTNVDFDLEELSQVLREMTDTNIFMSDKELEQRAKEKLAELNLQKNLGIEELKQQEEQNQFRNRQIVIFGAIALGVYAYKNGWLKA